MGALPYFYADHFVYLSIKVLPKGGGLPGCFFSFGGDHTSCHEGLEHTFIDDPPSTNGLLLFTGNGKIGPV